MELKNRISTFFTMFGKAFKIDSIWAEIFQNYAEPVTEKGVALLRSNRWLFLGG